MVRLSRLDGSGVAALPEVREYFIPEHVSRQMLMIHSFEFHNKHKLPFDQQPWENLGPRRSTTELASQVAEWLNDVVRPTAASAATAAATALPSRRTYANVAASTARPAASAPASGLTPKMSPPDESAKRVPHDLLKKPSTKGT